MTNATRAGDVRIEKILIREVGYDIIRIEKENSK